MSEQKLDNTGCVGNTIKVSAGHYVDLANPDPSTIDIGTIAAALSKMCRFRCHTPTFYSVAEHCFHATQLAKKQGYGRELLRAVLLHDAAEAYIGDVVKPLKIMLPDYAVVEQRMEDAVSKAFGVDFKEWEPVVKRLDHMMLKAEKLYLWPDDKEKWARFENVPDCKVDFECMYPPEAEWCFLRCAEELGFI